MNRLRTLAVLLVLPLAVAALTLVRLTDAAADDGVLYSLIVPPSSFQVGCQGPCECPILERPTYGSFTLVPDGSDPLYRYYRVENYIASFNNGPGAVSITGSGRYRIGGEFALTQQLTMDLSVWGQPAQHFDSGNVPIKAPFPAIDVACAVHGFYCYDSVLVVDAKPAGTTGIGRPDAQPAGIRSVFPNPFARRTEFVIALDRAAPVRLTVIDANGRRVRELGADRVAAGRTTLAWDGRGDDGHALPAGIYWLRMSWSDGMDERRIVKVD